MSSYLVVRLAPNLPLLVAPSARTWMIFDSRYLTLTQERPLATLSIHRRTC